MTSTLEFLILAKDQASPAFDKVGDTMDKNKGKFDKFRAGAGIALAAVGVAVAAFAVSSVKAYGEAETQQAKLDLAYEKFPALADVNIDSLRRLNDALQAKTGYDNDDTAAMQASLAAFGLTGAQIQKLTPLVQDYAARTGSDLATSADAVGKAMLGSGKALKTVGVDFTDTGTLAGNFDETVQGLTTAVGGYAETMGGTATGKTKILAAQWEDLQEKVGQKLMPALTKLTEVGIKVVDWISNNTETLKPYVIALGVAAVAFGVLNVIMAANPISLVVIALAAMVAGLIYAYQHSETFRKICDTSFKVIGEAATWLWNNALEPLFKFMAAGIANVMDSWANLLEGLGKVPGFGWARDAAKDLKGAADEVRGLGDSLKKIPPAVPVAINVNTKTPTENIAFIQSRINALYGKDITVKVGMSGALTTGHGVTVIASPFAAGGTIAPTPGGTIVRVAEAGRKETIVDTATLNAAMAQNMMGSDGPIELGDRTINAIVNGMVAGAAVSSQATLVNDKWGSSMGRTTRGRGY